MPIIAANAGVAVAVYYYRDMELETRATWQALASSPRRPVVVVVNPDFLQLRLRLGRDRADLTDDGCQWFEEAGPVRHMWRTEDGLAELCLARHPCWWLAHAPCAPSDL